MISVLQQRGFLYRVFDLTTTLTAAATTYATLIAALQALTAANFSVTASGTIVSTSANGHSVTFSQATASGSNPQDYSQFAAAARDLYTSARSALISAGIAAPTDLQVWTEMMDRPELQRITELGPSSMSTLRDS